MADARYAIPFEELRADQVELVGGKCANLGELTRGRLPGPARLRRHHGCLRARRHRRGGGRGLRRARAARRPRRPAGRRALERDRRGHAGRELRGRPGHLPLDLRARGRAGRHPPLLGELPQPGGGRLPRGARDHARRHERRRAVHGRRARRGRDVHAQPGLGRPLVDRDRRELRPRRLASSAARSRPTRSSSRR